MEVGVVWGSREPGFKTIRVETEKTNDVSENSVAKMYTEGIKNSSRKTYATLTHIGTEKTLKIRSLGSFKRRAHSWPGVLRPGFTLRRHIVTRIARRRSSAQVVITPRSRSLRQGVVGMEEQEKGVATIDHQEVHVNVGNTTSWPQGSIEYSTSKDGVTLNGKSDPSSQAPRAIVTQPDPKDKPKDFVVTSCLVLAFCNFIFGYLGYHYGLKSNYAWKLGDELEARKRAKTAMLFVVLGVIAGVATYILVFTLYFTLRTAPYPGRAFIGKNVNVVWTMFSQLPVKCSVGDNERRFVERLTSSQT
ncbi:hypothetical protein ScPMuIL_009490 [Solemya velum]